MVRNRITISLHHERLSLFNSALNTLARAVQNNPAKRDLDTVDGRVQILKYIGIAASTHINGK